MHSAQSNTQVILCIFVCLHVHILTAYKASCFQHFFFPLFLTPQVRKRVNDDTKDQIQHNDDNQEEEEQIVDNPRSKQRLLCSLIHTQIWRLSQCSVHRPHTMCIGVGKYGKNIMAKQQIFSYTNYIPRDNSKYMRKQCIIAFLHVYHTTCDYKGSVVHDSNLCEVFFFNNDRPFRSFLNLLLMKYAVGQFFIVTNVVNTSDCHIAHPCVCMVCKSVPLQMVCAARHQLPHHSLNHDSVQ